MGICNKIIVTWIIVTIALSIISKIYQFIHYQSLQVKINKQLIHQQIKFKVFHEKKDLDFIEVNILASNPLLQLFQESKQKNISNKQYENQSKKNSVQIIFPFEKQSSQINQQALQEQIKLYQSKYNEQKNLLKIKRQILFDQICTSLNNKILVGQWEKQQFHIKSTILQQENIKKKVQKQQSKEKIIKTQTQNSKDQNVKVQLQLQQIALGDFYQRKKGKFQLFFKYTVHYGQQKIENKQQNKVEENQSNAKQPQPWAIFKQKQSLTQNKNKQIAKIKQNKNFALYLSIYDGQYVDQGIFTYKIPITSQSRYFNYKSIKQKQGLNQQSKVLIQFSFNDIENCLKLHQVNKEKMLMNTSIDNKNDINQKQNNKKIVQNMDNNYYQNCTYCQKLNNYEKVTIENYAFYGKILKKGNQQIQDIRGSSLFKSFKFVINLQKNKFKTETMPSKHLKFVKSNDNEIQKLEENFILSQVSLQFSLLPTFFKFFTVQTNQKVMQQFKPQNIINGKGTLNQQFKGYHSLKDISKKDGKYLIINEFIFYLIIGLILYQYFIEIIKIQIQTYRESCQYSYIVNLLSYFCFLYFASIFLAIQIIHYILGNTEIISYSSLEIVVLMFILTGTITIKFYINLTKIQKLRFSSPNARLTFWIVYILSQVPRFTNIYKINEKDLLCLWIFANLWTIVHNIRLKNTHKLFSSVNRPTFMNLIAYIILRFMPYNYIELRPIYEKETFVYFLLVLFSYILLTLQHMYIRKILAYIINKNPNKIHQYRYQLIKDIEKNKKMSSSIENIQLNQISKKPDTKQKENNQLHQQEDVCAICLMTLQQDISSIIQIKSQNARQKYKDSFNMTPILITPCKHLYHSACLFEWMDSKMICPTCRKNLPQFQ